MSATDELRRLLDERGVEYQKLNEHVTWVFLEDRAITFFSDELGVSAEVSYPKPVLNGTKFLTPEQAIAATLGSGTLTAEQVKRIHEIIEKHWHDLPDEYDMPEATALPEYSYDWQAIADELNARAERTCVPTEDGCCPYCGDDLIKCDMAIGEGGGAVELDPPIYHNYCPNCGKAVKR